MNWCRDLSSRLLSLTHKQWLFRNSHVHYTKLDGLTPKQHDDIFDRVRDLMYTDPTDLLDGHQYLLEEDFQQLGEGSSGARLQWIESMESALKAAAFVRSGRPCRGTPGVFVPAAAYNDVILPSDDDGDCNGRRVRRNLGM